MSLEPNSSATSKPPQVVIIGGGLTGLAAAHRLVELREQSGAWFDITLLEAGSRWGGIVGSIEIAGHRVDVGADSFITNKPAAINLCLRLGLQDRLKPLPEQFRGALVLNRGRPVAVPDGFQLMTPSAAWPLILSPTLSTWGKLRMAAELFIPRKASDADESLAAFVRRRFGREALDRLVQPLVGGIYTSDPEKLSLQAALPRFIEQERKSGSLIWHALKEIWRKSNAATQTSEPDGGTSSGARYGLFAGFDEGMQVLIDAIVARLAHRIECRLQSSVQGIHACNQNDRTGYRVEMTSGESHVADAVVVTPPAWKTADLIRACHPNLAEELQGIEYASSAIVVSGHHEIDVGNPTNAFGLVIPHRERRKILAVSFAHRKFPARVPAGQVQFRTFVGGALQPELLDFTDEQIVDIVRGELTEILRVDWRPTFVKVVRYLRAMPQLCVGHLQRLRKIETASQEIRRLAIAGNAYQGVGVPDAIASGEAAAERIAKLFHA